MLGLVLVGMLGFWLVIANLVYNPTLGPQPPESLAVLMHDVLYTSAGWKMIFVGSGIGFVFAAVGWTISVVSFPMLLDKNQSLESTVRTSAEVVARNPLVIVVWGLIVPAIPAIGLLPLLLGLVVVLPVLGHATWHLYCRAVSFN